MKTITEKWCKYHAEFVYATNASEHLLAACEIRTIPVPVIDAPYQPQYAAGHVHRFELVDCARPLVCECGDTLQTLESKENPS